MAGIQEMAILLTGGLGFIGSHTAIELLAAGHEVLVIDNLRNAKVDTVNRIKDIAGSAARINHYEADVLDQVSLDRVMGTHEIACVIHFAASKSVSESIDAPLQYYWNNVVGMIGLLEACKKHGIGTFIFSSSATVYGGAHQSPLTEDLETGRGITNPYGRTKHMCEQILQDTCQATHCCMRAISLRYFNPVGAHPSGLLGEDPAGVPGNIMPYIVRTAVKNNLDSGLPEDYAELRVFGDDYDTPDGTAVRDFIHVVDLAKAHVKAVEKLQETGAGAKERIEVYNIGTGKGHSVRELIDAFGRVNGVHVPNRVVERRAGDLGVVFCDAGKATGGLGWSAELGLEEMCRDAYTFACRRADAPPQ